MFGTVHLKKLFRTSNKRDCSARFLEIPCRGSNRVVCVAVRGRFGYLIQDDTVQVATFSL